LRRDKNPCAALCLTPTLLPLIPPRPSFNYIVVRVGPSRTVAVVVAAAVVVVAVAVVVATVAAAAGLASAAVDTSIASAAAAPRSCCNRTG